MMLAWDWREDLSRRVLVRLGRLVRHCTQGAAHHGGRGSLWFRLAISDPRERVSCTSRWRDCSSTLIWSDVRVAMLEDWTRSE
jgi:hypothetical protein